MLANGVKETTATTGTGTVTLAAVAGFVRVSQAFSIGERVSYEIEDGSNREWGIGTVASGNTLERTAVLGTLSGGTLTRSGATALPLSGSATVICTPHGGNWIGQPIIMDGNWFADPSALSQYLGTVGGINNILRAVPIAVPRPVRLTSAAINVATAQAGASVQAAIYADNGSHYPGKRVLLLADFVASATGIVSQSIDIVLSPGVYWSAWRQIGNAAGLSLRSQAYANSGSLSAANWTDSNLTGNTSARGSIYGNNTYTLDDPFPPTGPGVDTASAKALFFKGTWL